MLMEWESSVRGISGIDVLRDCETPHVDWTVLDTAVQPIKATPGSEGGWLDSIELGMLIEWKSPDSGITGTDVAGDCKTPRAE